MTRLSDGRVISPLTPMALIPNIHENIPNLELVQAKIDPKIFHYFFQECLTGYRGPRQAFITFFFQRFYEACVEAGIRGPWDVDVELAILEVLKRLNFDQHERPPQS